MSAAPRQPRGPTNGGPAPDLTPEERPVAAWFDHLERHDVPESVRRAVLAARPAAVLKRPRGRWIQAFPLGAWGVASAAVLLVALGIAATVELTDPAVPSAGVQTGGAPAAFATDVVILEDATMALFHDVETFDEIGLPPGDMIADWGR